MNYLPQANPASRFDPDALGLHQPEPIPPMGDPPMPPPYEPEPVELPPAEPPEMPPPQGWLGWRGRPTAPAASNR